MCSAAGGNFSPVCWRLQSISCNKLVYGKSQHESFRFDTLKGSIEILMVWGIWSKPDLAVKVLHVNRWCPGVPMALKGGKSHIGGSTSGPEDANFSLFLSQESRWIPEIYPTVSSQNHRLFELWSYLFLSPSPVQAGTPGAALDHALMAFEYFRVKIPQDLWDTWSGSAWLHRAKMNVALEGEGGSIQH